VSIVWLDAVEQSSYPVSASASAISGGALMGIGHGLMGVAMAVVVYRHRHDHH